MRVLVCGDRDYDDINRIRAFCFYLPKHDTVIIHGDAKGADRMAGIAARESGLFVRAYPADWDRHGRGAGMIRNKQMLIEGKPDLVVYFHNDIAHSKGTKDMVNRALSMKIPVIGNPSP